MVCRELDELCAKFGSLSPHLRIDYMYGMLRMCLPPELRFIGSVVEDLAKKDFNFLREHENKANNQAELKKYSSVDEKTLIEGMAFNLSLLHSVNTACANIIFNLLQENLKGAFHVSPTTDKTTVDIILLVLTMAKYHPAFTFHQRTTIAEYYTKVEQQLHNICAKTNDHDRHSPNPVSSVYCTCSVAAAQKVHSPLNTDIHQRAHITSIEVKQDKPHRRHDRKHEFRIKVSWSNGETTEIGKTFQELRDFHQKLHQQFPDEEDRRHEGISPYLGCPQKEEGNDHISQQVITVIGYLSNLPKSVKEWDQFIQFFKGDNNVNPPLQQTVVPDSQSISDKANEGELVGCIQPMASVPYFGPTYRPPINQSPQSSNHCSPSNSRSSSPGETGVDQVAALLNKLQLQKHKIRLEKMTVEELSCLNVDTMIREFGISSDDATKIFTELEERSRQKHSGRLPNGIVENIMPGPISPYQAMYMPPPPPQVYQMLHFPYANNVPVRNDTSSSENSSPSRSPIPQKKPQQKGLESSSDDSEKGNRVDSPHFEETKTRHSSQSRDEVNRETPPQTVPHGNENVYGHSGGSGYQSDPTQGTFVRYIMANNSYKPQPTHTNPNLPNKSVISMPDSMTGRQIGYVVPHPRCDVQTLTTSIPSSSNSNAPEIARRPIFPGPVSFIRSPTINGQNFMCSTNATTPVMSTNLQSNINVNVRGSTLTSSISDPLLSPNPNVDTQNGSGTSGTSPLPNGIAAASCSATNVLNSSSHSQCTSCGCTGGHNTMPSPPYQYHIGNQYIQNQMLIPPLMSAPPNGYVHPVYHWHYPHLMPNGIPPNYMQAIGQQFFIPRAQNNCIPQVVVQRRNSTSHPVGKAPKTTSVTCSNCGSTDHASSECKENSMESMSASFSLKYDPKSNSD